MSFWLTTRGYLVSSWATYCGNATTEVLLSSGCRKVSDSRLDQLGSHAVTAVATGIEALEALRSTGAGTFQLVLTVSHVGFAMFWVGHS